MTRLFLRLYFGVVLILIASWMILGYVYQTRTAEKNVRTIEHAFAGPAKHIRDDLIGLPRHEAEKRFLEIKSKYDFDMRVVSEKERAISAPMLQRLRRGTPVFYQGMIETEFPNSDLLLELGPLPPFEPPSQTERTLGFGAIFMLAAIAIAILLRPVAAQLQMVERTATAIASGDLSARIKHKRWRRQLPLETAFNTMAERTETLVESQRQLLQAVSHELRTPLARIRFATDLVETSSTQAERQQRLAAVDKATQELDDLVGELLTYARMESETSEDDQEPIEIGELISELLASRGPLHPSVQFDVAPESELPNVIADRGSLSRAVGNLLSNAGRHARQRVLVTTRYQGNQLTIRVDDDGPGIPEADRLRVFDPFVRLQDSEGRGAGLGLALVHRIATGHGGNVIVVQSPLGGARFELTIAAG